MKDCEIKAGPWMSPSISNALSKSLLSIQKRFCVDWEDIMTISLEQKKEVHASDFETVVPDT
jgi:hypothetical protein